MCDNKMKFYFWISPNFNFESPYAVNYNELQQDWFRQNKFGLVEYLPFSSMKNKIVVNEN